jgi:DNA modification methylase
VIYKQKQYTDTWSLEEYLQFLYERLYLIRDLLKDTGSIYVHLDEDAAHYIKIILDEVFGRENFRRQIIWNTASLNVAGFKGNVRDNYIYASGIILFYTKSDSYTFNPQYNPHSKEFIEKKYKKKDENGRYRITRRNNKIYLKDDSGEPITNVWNDILSFNYAKAASRESVFYPTQKPEALLRRIILTSSNPGDVVLDCFAGSGTTSAVAQKLNRKWIACDNNANAIHISSKRIQRIICNENSLVNTRSFQVWDEKKHKTTINPIKILGERKNAYLTLSIAEIDNSQIYANTDITPKTSLISNYSLIDSIFVFFSTDSQEDNPFQIHFSDIPRGRKESIVGTYRFFIPKWKENDLITKIRIYDIFGNMYEKKMKFSAPIGNDWD